MGKISKYFIVVCSNCNSDNVSYWGQHQDTYTGTYHFLSCHNCGLEVCIDHDNIIRAGSNQIKAISCKCASGWTAGECVCK